MAWGKTVSSKFSSLFNDREMYFPFGEIITGYKHDDLSVQFQYNYFDTNFDVTLPAVTGDGVQSVTNSIATVSSAATGTAMVQSINSIRYRPGHSGYADFTASFSGTGTAHIGPHDHYNNGFVLKYINGVMSFGYIKSSVEYLDAQTDWINQAELGNIDFSKMNVFRIVFGYLGSVSPILFVKKGKWIPLHTVKTEGVLTGTHVDTPVFPMIMYAENGASVSSGSWAGGVIGNGNQTGSRFFSFPITALASGAGPEQGEVTLSSTTVKTAVIFHSKSLFKTKANNIKASVFSIGVSVDTPATAVIGEIIIQLIGNPTYSGTPTYTDINTASSIIEYDHTPGTGASVSYASGGKIIKTFRLNYAGTGKGSSVNLINIDAEKIGAFAYADSTFCLLVKDTAGNNVTVRFDFNWEEKF